MHAPGATGAEERRSVSGLPLCLPGVTPSAAPGQTWRQAVAWSFSGVLAAGGALATYTVITTDEEEAALAWAKAAGTYHTVGAVVDEFVHNALRHLVRAHKAELASRRAPII